jgi:hypothetical protein
MAALGSVDGSDTNGIVPCMLVDDRVNVGVDMAVRLAVVVGAVVSSAAFAQVVSTEHAQRGCTMVVQFCQGHMVRRRKSCATSYEAVVPKSLRGANVG